MKRSSRLALLTAAGATAIIAYTWYNNQTEPEVDTSIYSSIGDCVGSGVDEAVCKARFGEALDAYIKTAPRFVTKEDCEKDFGAGACGSAPAFAHVAASSQTATAPVEVTQPAQQQQAGTTTTSYFMPMMMGFMMGRMMQGSTMAPGAGAGNYAAGKPMFGCASGAPNSSCYTSNTARRYTAAARTGNTFRAPVSEFRANTARSGFSVVPRGGSVKSLVSSRGGFGSTGRSYSGGLAGG